MKHYSLSKYANSKSDVDRKSFLMGLVQASIGRPLVATPGFLNNVKIYEHIIDLLRSEIEKNPYNWQDYQECVNHIVDSVFALCADFELENYFDPDKVMRMKRLFIRHFRKYFRLGSCNRTVMDRPYGYVGDFKILDDIYMNQPKSIGVERCLDNYFLATPASVATRNRKNDFCKFIIDAISNSSSAVEIMNLGSGPCRDVAEILMHGDTKSSEFRIDCVEREPHAIEYARNLIQKTGRLSRVDFLSMDVVRMGLSKHIRREVPNEYDLIYSTGLFDYLGDRLVIRLLANLRALLKKDGKLIIANYRDRFSNPSRFYMEWGGDWELIYRTEGEFLNLFLMAGFPKSSLGLRFEKQHIMQYCFAKA